MNEHKQNAQEGLQPSDVSRSKKKKLRWTTVGLMVLLGFIVIAAIIAAVGLANGQLYAGVKDPAQRVDLRYPLVCGSDMVKTYNDISMPVSEKDLESLKSMAATIDKNSGSVHDPTCQALKFYTAYQMNDANKMKDALDIIRTLHADGRFIDNDLKTSLSITVMELLVANTKQAGQ